MVFNLHLIDACNFKCKHCFINKEGYELSFDKIKIIGKKLACFQETIGEKVRVNLAGGEPLLSKNIQQIIDYLNSLGLIVSIITNGYYLTKEFIEYNRNKLSMIGISVDSLNHDTNIKIGRCYDNKTLSEEELINISKCIKDNNIKLKINLCITPFNVNEDINYFINEVSPDRFKLLRSFCSQNEYKISNEEWEMCKKKYPSAISEDNDYMAEYYLIIDSKGNVGRDNLHLNRNSIIDNSIDECLKNINCEVDLCH